MRYLFERSGLECHVLPEFFSSFASLPDAASCAISDSGKSKAIKIYKTFYKFVKTFLCGGPHLFFSTLILVINPLGFSFSPIEIRR